RTPTPPFADPPHRSVVHHDPADVLACVEVVVRLRHLVEPVPGGDELVEFEHAPGVQVDQPRDVHGGTRGAEQRALQPLLEDGQLKEGDGQAPRGRVAYAGNHDGAGLADGGESVRYVRRCGHADGHDRGVSALPAGECPGELGGFVDVCHRVG